jgi:hypothetical protein
MAKGRSVTRVPSVEEIQRLNELREAREKGIEPPIRASVVRIEAPPVGVIPTDQTPPKTLAEVEEKTHLTVAEILKREQIDPIEELLTMYNERDEDPDSPNYGKFVMSRAERVSLMKEIMRYQHPTLKAVEHKGNVADQKITVVLMMPDGSQHHKNVAQRGEVLDA